MYKDQLNGSLNMRRYVIPYKDKFNDSLNI